MDQQPQENRFELKYIISEAQARALREYVRGILAPDDHADPARDYSYAIHSVYLDSPGMRLYQATVEGHKNRFKLRARYYDDRPDAPVYFEVKRRLTDAILKRRAPVRREWALDLIHGAPPRRDYLLNPSRDHDWEALEEFCLLRDRIEARGRVVVTYLREALVTPENNAVRLTMDRQIHGLRWDGRLSTDGMVRGVAPAIGGVVLELKFTTRYPPWMRDVALMFNLTRTAMPKYVHCVRAVPAPAPRPVARMEAVLQ
jgi:SPX domain protein involved in polyphosphate accumulation